jgi:hypothetical protein
MHGSQMIYAILLIITGIFAVSQPAADPGTCSERLAGLFTPAAARLGRYEACTTVQPITTVAPRTWSIIPTPPLDAFGENGSYDQARVARLYGGRQPLVARGWLQDDGHFVAITLISPYPDETLTHLLPGTLILRLII